MRRQDISIIPVKHHLTAMRNHYAQKKNAEKPNYPYQKLCQCHSPKKRNNQNCSKISPFVVETTKTGRTNPKNSENNEYIRRTEEESSTQICIQMSTLF